MNTIQHILRAAALVPGLILLAMLSSGSVSAAETEFVSGEVVDTGESSESFAAGEAALTDAEETASAFQTIVSYEAPVFTDPINGLTYTLTLSGATVEVNAVNYLSALAAGDEETYLAILNAQISSFYWDGSFLTELAGINYGPSGKETWYNLDMTPVITTLRENGYEGEYWVRNDGCKMYGLYILCAVNSDTGAFGSLIETSLGTGIIADTGCPAGIVDIATAW